MAIFCTQCGTQNNDDAAFCENCGAATRAVERPVPAAVVNPSAPLAAKPAAARSMLALYVVAGVFGLLLLGGMATYFWLAPPAASSGNLLVAVKAEFADEKIRLVKNGWVGLCDKKIDYSQSRVALREYDNTTRDLMNALVVAGLYSGPEIKTTNNGFFRQTQLEYQATAELEKWRDGKRLCLAKQVEVVNVTQIETPKEEVLDADSEIKFRTVRAKIVYQTTGTAPWLERTEVQRAMLDPATGWNFKNGDLSKIAPVRFVAHDGQWIANAKQIKALADASYPSVKRSPAQAAQSSAAPGDLFAKLARLFDFGGHPLKGTWQADTSSGLLSLLKGMPGFDSTMTITSDTIEGDGKSVECKFEVKGNKVFVTPAGESVAVVFEMIDRDTAELDVGLLKLRFKRVK
jgi:zinc-ribbon domain